jgi:Skp family chaperone for outer membrane proteins
MYPRTGLSLAIAVSAAAAMFYAGSSGAQAPGGGTPRIAVCDLTEVFAKLRISAALEQRFQQLKQTVEQEAQTRRKEISDLQKELEAFPSGSDDYRKRRDALLQKQVEAEVWIRQKEARLRDSHKEWFEKVYRDVMKAVEALSLEHGYDIVLADNPIQFDVPDVEALIAQIRQKSVIRASAGLPNLASDLIERLDRDFEQAGGAAQIHVDI